MISSQFFLTDYINNNHPHFLIIPLQTKDVIKNSHICKEYKFNIRARLSERFPNKYVTITKSGRKALEIALQNNPVKRIEQRVYIQTTSDNYYISSCVTNTIEKENHWDRNLKAEHDVVLVNHEFGYVDNRISKSERDKLLVEDCAFAFNSTYDDGRRCGTNSDFAIFSFSKFFPIQFGGFLVSNEPVDYEEDRGVTDYINSVVGYYFDQIDYWTEYRRKIFIYYVDMFADFGCLPYFPLRKGDVPGVFLFKTPLSVDLNKLKLYFWRMGIQCSIFYGENAFYLPLHQFITEQYVNFFADLYNNFITGNE